MTRLIYFLLAPVFILMYLLKMQWSPHGMRRKSALVLWCQQIKR